MLLSDAFLLRLFAGAVDRFSEDKKSLVKEFGNKVQDHIERGHEVFIPSGSLDKIVAEYGGYGGEYRVICERLKHRNGNVVGRFEGEFSVECKVPDDGEKERDEVAGPIAPAYEFVQ